MTKKFAIFLPPLTPPSPPAVLKSNITQQELPLPGVEITTKEKEGGVKASKFCCFLWSIPYVFFGWYLNSISRYLTNWSRNGFCDCVSEWFLVKSNIKYVIQLWISFDSNSSLKGRFPLAGCHIFFLDSFHLLCTVKISISIIVISILKVIMMRVYYLLQHGGGTMVSAKTKALKGKRWESKGEIFRQKDAQESSNTEWYSSSFGISYHMVIFNIFISKIR